MILLTQPHILFSQQAYTTELKFAFNGTAFGYAKVKTEHHCFTTVVINLASMSKQEKRALSRYLYILMLSRFNGYPKFSKEYIFYIFIFLAQFWCTPKKGCIPQFHIIKILSCGHTVDFLINDYFLGSAPIPTFLALIDVLQKGWIPLLHFISLKSSHL